jgi:hypothetical protein
MNKVSVPNVQLVFFFKKPKTYQHPLISSLIMFVVGYQESFQTILSVHGLGTRNMNQLYVPTPDLQCFREVFPTLLRSLTVY